MTATPSRVAARLGRRAPLGAALAVVAAGCAGGPVAERPGEIGLDPIGRIDAAESMVRGEAQGLEAHWWVVDDQDHAVARALAPFATVEAGSADPVAGANWRANGLRLVRAPLDSYQSLTAAMPPSRTFQRVWIGETPDWRELLRGRSVAAGRRLLIGGRLTRLPAGSLRLLTRAWVTPTPQGPRLSLELTPHVDLPQPGRVQQLFEQLDAPPSVTETARGLTLDDLWLSARLGPDEMLIVTADRPSADWSAVPPPSASRAAAVAGGAEDPPPDQAEPDDGAIPWDPTRATATGPPGFGPRAVRALTPGEAMLSAPPKPVGGPAPKVVLVLIPRLPDRFTLLAPNPAIPEPPSS